MRPFPPAKALAAASALALALALALAACQPAPGTAPSPDAGTAVARATVPVASPSATAARSVTPSVTPSVMPSASGPRPMCRAVSLAGNVLVVEGTDGGRGPALAVQSEIPEGDWIELGPGARLAAKDPRTTRETLFGGPALVRICTGHREESWLAAGTFQSEPGAGESPGTEEWVVTPLGVLRFSAAKLRVEVSKASPSPSANVEVESGVAFAWIAPDVRTQGLDAGVGGGGPQRSVTSAWERVSGASLRLSPVAERQAPVAAARAAVERCEAIAHHAEDLTRTLLAPRSANGDAGLHAGQAIAETIMDQVSTREIARAACAVAAVRAGALGKEPPGKEALAKDKDDLERRLQSAEKAWTALPVAPPASAPSSAAP